MSDSAYEVVTLGGRFFVNLYEPSDDGGGGSDRLVGASIRLVFVPNELVVAPNIGLVQTVTTLKSEQAGGAIDVPSFLSRHKANEGLKAGDMDPGRVIDQTDRSSEDSTPNTNPVYVIENGQIGDGPRSISATLDDVRPDLAKNFGDLGSRTAQANGDYVTHEATLRDHPRRALEFEGQGWVQRFEVAALVLDGPMANVYLGSVAWGWRFDGQTLKLDPDALRLAGAVSPSAAFMAAARKWNEEVSVWDWPKARRHPHVAVPLTTFDSWAISPPLAPRDLLVARLAEVQSRLTALPAGVDQVNAQFEATALRARIGGDNVGVVAR